MYMNLKEINNMVEVLHNKTRQLYTKIYTTMEEPRKSFFDEPEGQLTADQFIKFSSEQNKLRNSEFILVDIVAFKTKYTSENQFNIMKYKVRAIHENLANLDTLLATVYLRHHLTAVSKLAVIGAIFLPLTFIVGWFGMNFNSMGAQLGKRGIFSITYGQKFIAILCIICIIIMGVLFKGIELPGTGRFSSLDPESEAAKTTQEASVSSRKVPRIVGELPRHKNFYDVGGTELFRVIDINK